MFNQRPGIPIADRRSRDADAHLLYIYPEDIATLHAVCKVKGLEVTALRVTKHAFKEFDLRGPDGHRLRFCQPTSEPPKGET